MNYYLNEENSQSQTLDSSNTSRLYVNSLREKYDERTQIFEKYLNYSNIRKEILNESASCPPDLNERNGLRFDKTGKLYLPSSLEYLSIARVHVEQGHIAGPRIYELLKNTYAFKSNKEVKSKCIKYARACVNCLTASPNRHGYVQGTTFQEATKPGQCISADCFFFSYNIGSAQNLRSQQALVVVDHFSKKASTYLLGKANDEDIIRCLSNYFSENGIPEKFLSDNGSNFRSQKFSYFLDNCGVKQLDSSPYHPRGRALAENSIGRIRRILRTLSVENQNFSPQLLLILATSILNNTQQ